MKNHHLLTIIFILPVMLASIGTFAQQITKFSDYPDEIRERNFFKRYEWFYKQRAIPNDTIPFTQANNAVNEAIREIQEDKIKKRSNLSWHSLGPKGFDSKKSPQRIVSGRVRALAVHPTDPLTVYIGAASGGIWKTVDGGETWLDIGRDLASLTFGAIAIDPQNPEIVYAGAGEPVHTIVTGIVFGGKGLYKSTDGGLTWKRITNGFGSATFFSSLAVSPHYPNILFAGLASGSINMDINLSNEGLWKSVDSGETWNRIMDLPDPCDVKFHPENDSIVYASMGGTNENSGFYISHDLGENWVQHNNGLAPAYKMSRILFDFCRSDLNVFYCVIYQYTPTAYGPTSVFKSIDGGMTWNEIGSATNFGYPFDQGPYDLCIAVDPLEPNHLFVGNVTLFESHNGLTFNWRSMTHGDIHMLVFSPSNPAHFYIGTDGGIYRSDNSGASSNPINKGLETLQFYRIASHPTNPDIFMGGMQDNNSIITFDGGETWKVTYGGDGMECKFNQVNPQIVIGSSQKGDFYKSNNGGENFSWFKYVSGAWITPFVMDPNNPDTVYSVNKHLVLILPNHQTIKFFVTPTLINTMAQSQLNSKYFIIGSGGSVNGLPNELEDEFLVKISVDKGISWTDVTENIPGEKRWISKVVTDPYDAETMYVVRCGYSPGNKLHKTEDLGQNWINISGDLPDIPCNDLFIDPEIPGHLYIATDLGVYATENGGTSWYFAGEGMPLVPVLDFDYVKIDGTRYLRVATFGRSIYETTDLISHVGEISHSYNSEIRVIPNPFTNSATIAYNLNKAETVEIKIYDAAGNIIDVLRENQSQGKQTMKWGSTDVPEGLYIIKLKAGDQLGIGKMIKH